MLFDYVVSSETGKTGGKPWPSSNIEEEEEAKERKRNYGADPQDSL
jgi:hypothetical protein